MLYVKTSSHLFYCWKCLALIFTVHFLLAFIEKCRLLSQMFQIYLNWVILFHSQEHLELSQTKSPHETLAPLGQWYLPVLFPAALLCAPATVTDVGYH